MELEKLAELIDINARMAYQHTLNGSNRSMKQFERMKDVKVGDMVTETSAAFVVPAIKRLGHLEEIFKGEDGFTHYIIRKLDGTTTDWSNCSFVKVFEKYIFD